MEAHLLDELATLNDCGSIDEAVPLSIRCLVQVCDYNEILQGNPIFSSVLLHVWSHSLLVLSFGLSGAIWKSY